jgi:hypothetical protein
LVEGPGDGQSWVIPEDAAFAGGGVEASGLVEDFGGFREDEEAVGEAFGDPEHLEFACGIAGAEVEAGPLTEGG